MDNSYYLNIIKKASADIDPQAVAILKRLKDSQHDAYLVGGCVRDLLVGIQPKDFDIATSALPNEVKRRVPYCFIIGRRFKLVHARRGDKIFEIATYRREATQEELESHHVTELPMSEENYFGNLKEDSFRRDFTVNALFYDPISEELVDHCDGLADITTKTIRMIGDPLVRIKEDPIRILRAIRLSQKLNFSIEQELRKAIHDNIQEIERAVTPRRREEWLKFFKLPSIDLALMELFDLGVFKAVIPAFHELFEDHDKQEHFRSYIRQISGVGLNLSDSVELLAGVIYSFLLAQYEHPLKININEISENPRFQLFCREELGIFKAEIVSIELSIQFIRVLRDRDYYLKKGERKRVSLLNNIHFDLALKLGLLSGELDANDFAFWMHEKDQSTAH
ncbi:MAG: poly(A) polymerase [Moraxellaceae bacterium]|nr:poly(A) polymerase [Pseudobdellovibrionaceae bacterium]